MITWQDYSVVDPRDVPQAPPYPDKSVKQTVYVNRAKTPNWRSPHGL